MEPRIADRGSLGPQVLDASGLASVVDASRAAAARALDSGFTVVELHAAHGYRCTSSFHH